MFIYLKNLLAKKNMSCYRLSKQSGIPQSTIHNLVNGKSNIMKCSVETLYKLSTTLNIKMDDLVTCIIDEQNNNSRVSFDVFKSHICHLVKDKGDIDFMIDLLENDDIRNKKLAKPLYPASLKILYKVLDKKYDDVFSQAIPEFLHFNIIESDIRNVC